MIPNSNIHCLSLYPPLSQNEQDTKVPVCFYQLEIRIYSWYTFLRRIPHKHYVTMLFQKRNMSRHITFFFYLSKMKWMYFFLIPENSLFFALEKCRKPFWQLLNVEKYYDKSRIHIRNFLKTLFCYSLLCYYYNTYIKAKVELKGGHYQYLISWICERWDCLTFLLDETFNTRFTKPVQITNVKISIQNPHFWNILVTFVALTKK